MQCTSKAYLRKVHTGTGEISTERRQQEIYI